MDGRREVGQLKRTEENRKIGDERYKGEMVDLWRERGRMKFKEVMWYMVVSRR